MAVSNLVTTGGLSQSDLITEPVWTLLGSYASTSGTSTISITGLPSGYRKFRIMAWGISGSTGSYIRMRFNNDSSNYYYSMITAYTANSSSYQTFFNSATVPYTAFAMQAWAATANPRYLFLDINNPSSTTDFKFFTGKTIYQTSTYQTEDLYGFVPITSAISSIQFWAESGTLNTSSGTYGIYVYGAK